jgi:hypothetical protein
MTYNYDLNSHSQGPTMFQKTLIGNKFSRSEFSRHRITSRCSTNDNILLNNQKFDSLLRINGYPSNFINRTYSTEHNRIDNNQPTEWFYVKIPFINDRINGGLLSIFKQEKLPVRFYHANASLRNLLKKRISSTVLCSCPFNNVCSRQNVIYEMTCRVCSSIYIGSTIRTLHVRLNEHLTNMNSSVYRHLRVCQNQNPQLTDNRLMVKVLAFDRDAINLRIKEAIFIKKKQPQINSREEMNDILINY